ncbi:MAG: uncharacterized protein PWP65_696 [Clostridia bacterium]|nr:uncharacterized protein [Clostridia bacterium]
MVTLVFIILLALLAGFLGLYWRRLFPRPAAKLQTGTQETESKPGELPASYGKDQIVVMVKDPYWLYAYWEITDKKRAEFRRQFGPDSWEKSQPMLRVYDLTHNLYDFLHAPFFEIAITENADNWYIQVNRPCHTFCVDIGRLLPLHGFVTLARSNIVTTPADQPSSKIDPLWPPLQACWEAVAQQRGLPPGISSAELLALIRKD